MSCECGHCRQHCRTLGIAYGVPSESEFDAAYQESAKQWDPSLYADYASLRTEAEQRFEQIQIAYRELKAHNKAGGPPAETSPVQPARSSAYTAYTASIEYDQLDQPSQAMESAQSVTAPELSFDGEPGCLVASQFNAEIKEMIEGHLGKQERAVAIVDLSGNRSRGARAPASVPSHDRREPGRCADRQVQRRDERDRGHSPPRVRCGRT